LFFGLLLFLFVVVAILRRIPKGSWFLV
jgi:hypothetical protein